MKRTSVLALGVVACTLLGGLLVRAPGFAGEGGLVVPVQADEGEAVSGGMSVVCTHKLINILLACGTPLGPCPQGTTCPGNFSIYVADDAGSYMVPAPGETLPIYCHLCGFLCSNSHSPGPVPPRCQLQQRVSTTWNCSVP